MVFRFFYHFFYDRYVKLHCLKKYREKNIATYSLLFFSIAVGGTINLVLIIEFVLDLTPFYEPRYVVPIAGMIYTNSMNAISLAAE